MSIAQRPYLFAGMAFYWIWINMGYQTPIVFRPVELVSGLTMPSQIGPLCMSFIAYVAISVWFRERRTVFQHNGYVWLVGVLMAVASAILVVWLDCTMAPTGKPGVIALSAESVGQLSLILYLVGSLFFGASAACMCIEMQRIYGSLGSEHVLFHGSVAMLGSVLLLYALSFTPEIVQQSVFVLAPLPVAFFLLRGRKGFTKVELFSRGLDAELNIPYKLLITALLHGLSFGILLGYPTLQSGGTVLLTCSIVSYALAALLMLFTAISVKLNFNSLMYQIGFPIAAAGMYLSILFGGDGYAGISVQLVGFCFLHLIMWGACAFLIKNFDLPSTWVIGTSTGAFMAGQLAGALVSGSISQLPDSWWWFDKVSLTTLVIVLCASLYMMSSRNMRTGWGLSKPDTYQPGTEEDTAFATRTLVSDFELTKREADMLAGLVRGKNRKAMSEELCVSTETAKSHIQNIYKKIGVHSQQELIRYVEDLREQSRR